MMRSRFEPRDDAWEERVRASFGKQGAMRLVGASIVELGPGICAIAVPPEFRARSRIPPAAMRR
jgi:hypothetical protein